MAKQAKQAKIVSFEDARAASKGAGVRGAGAASRRSGEPSRGSSRTGASERYRYAIDEDDWVDDIWGSDDEGSTRGSAYGASRSSRTSRASDQATSRQRERTKARAERMYNRQFSADSLPDPSQVEGAPRAALYEGQMGSTHRKAARMQRASSAGSVSAKIDPSGWFAGTSISERTLKLATAVFCVILTCMFLYVPAQQYYQAQRERDRLAAEYSVIEERNEALDVQNDILASDAGMEDAVRQKYGYVRQGEQAGVVTGLSDSATDNQRNSDNIEANVLSSGVKAPEEWYTPLLDAFFGVE